MSTLSTHHEGVAATNFNEKDAMTSMIMFHQLNHALAPIYPYSSQPSSLAQQQATTQAVSAHFPVTGSFMAKSQANAQSMLPPASHSTEGNRLDTIPDELKIQIFGYLDKIDSCCLGLSSPSLYGIYIEQRGVKMPLNTRREGPNRLESAWQVAGSPSQQCTHCGIYRCQLHQHIKSWMSQDLDYCPFRLMFGSQPAPGTVSNCFRAKPSKPHRCGRHPVRTTSKHQDDNTMSMHALP